MIAYVLDENISPVIGDQVAAKNEAVIVHSVLRWQESTLVGQPDIKIWRAATQVYSRTSTNMVRRSGGQEWRNRIAFLTAATQTAIAIITIAITTEQHL